MFFDKIFQLIREEEIVIWAGAGFSKYAGYPVGNALGKVIHDSLSESEKLSVNVNAYLPELVNDFIRVKNGSRNKLIEILNKTYLEHTPTSTIYHEKLSQIPHIKTIITTNYDQLFEKAYGPKAQLMYEDKKIAYRHKDKVDIFKVHGDLSDPDSILISKDDFTEYFHSQRNKLLWALITERIATKNVLFLGYSLEDPNVDSILKTVGDILQRNQKEMFLIAPGLLQPKVNELTRRNVQYIDSTAEKFIEELLIDLKKK